MAAASSPAAAPAPAAATRKPDPAADDPRWQTVFDLPCEISVELPLPHFKVADFLGMRPGSVSNTGWSISRDVPLRVNGVLIGWGELEGVGKKLAVRLTELA